MMKKVLNDLYDYKDMKIYQYEEGFKFSLDSILLAELVNIHKNDKTLLDLCTGNAAIPLILSCRSNLRIVGMEVQPEIVELADQSIKINHKEQQIQVIESPISKIDNYFPGNNFDIITCNPPYFKVHHEKFLNESKLKQIARHEVLTNLKEIVDIVNYSLKDKGNFYLVHVPERFQEIIDLLEKKQIRIKDVYLVYPKKHQKAELILIRAIKKGNIGMKIHEPIYLSELTTYQNLFQSGDLK